MASTYSSDLKLELMATGEKAGQWGDITNSNLVILQQAISGYEQVSVASTDTITLTFTDGQISNGKNAVLDFTGTPSDNVTVTIPDSLEKTYIVKNSTSGSSTLTIKTTSGSGATFSGTDKGYKFLQADGTNVNEVQVGTGGIADDAVTLAKLASGTAGNLITYDVSGDPAAVTTGTSGQVLTSNGAGAAPTFQDAGGVTTGKAIAMAIVFG